MTGRRHHFSRTVQSGLQPRPRQLRRHVAGKYTVPFWRDRWFSALQLSGLLLARSGYTSSASSRRRGRNRPSRVWRRVQLFRPESGQASSTTQLSTAGSIRLRSRRRAEATWWWCNKTCSRPGQFTIDAALVKLTRIGAVDTEVRLEAFNVLNHPTARDFQPPFPGGQCGYHLVPDASRRCDSCSLA